MNNITITYKNKEYPIRFTNYDKLQMLRVGVSVMDFIMPKENEPLTRFLNALSFVVKCEEDFDWDNEDDVIKFLNDFEDIYTVSGKILLSLKRDGLIQLPDNVSEELGILDNSNGDKSKNEQTPQVEEKSKKRQKKRS